MKKVFKAIFNFFKRMMIAIVRYFVLVFKQIKKMRWPDKKTMIEATSVVLVFVVFMGIYFMIDDFIIVNLLKLIKY